MVHVGLPQLSRSRPAGGTPAPHHEAANVASTPPSSRPAPSPAVTSRGLWAPTYTRPTITRTVSRPGTHHHSIGSDGATTHAHGCDEDDVPRGKARSRRRNIAAQQCADLAGSGPLTDGEVVGHLLADDPFGDQLEHHRRDRPDGHDEVAVDEGDREAGAGADDEVAQLHRQPQHRVELVWQPVDGVEHAGLGRADRWPAGFDDRHARR